MSIFNFKLIDGQAELAKFSRDRGEMLVFKFDECAEGFVRLGGISASISSSRAEFSLLALEDGSLFPELLADGKVIPLPLLRKSGRDIFPVYPSPEQFNALLKRERELLARVTRLEATVSDLVKKVYGTPLFEFPAPKFIGKRGN